jgi:hypothetical protein
VLLDGPYLSWSSCVYLVEVGKIDADSVHPGAPSYRRTDYGRVLHVNMVQCDTVNCSTAYDSVLADVTVVIVAIVRVVWHSSFLFFLTHMRR